MSWSPAGVVVAAAQAAGLSVDAAEVRLELLPAPLSEPPTWVSAVFLRAARGDRAAAAGLATRAAASAPDAVVASAADDGLFRLRPGVGVPLAPEPGWAEALSPRPQAPRGSARTLENPWYRAQLAHARLSRRGATTAPAQIPAGLAGLLPDAVRVGERVRLEGRPHHLVDWIARTGAAVVTWSEDCDPRDADPQVVTGLRDALASALRAVGLHPVERF